jgi:hypothetical protein
MLKKAIERSSKGREGRQIEGSVVERPDLASAKDRRSSGDYALPKKCELKTCDLKTAVINNIVHNDFSPQKRTPSTVRTQGSVVVASI